MELSVAEKDRLAALWAIHRSLVIAEYMAALESGKRPAMLSWFKSEYWPQMSIDEQHELLSTMGDTVERLVHRVAERRRAGFHGGVASSWGNTGPAGTRRG